MCGRVNSNPSLAYNSNFDLLVSKCRGVSPARDNNRPDNSQSYLEHKDSISCSKSSSTPSRGKYGMSQYSLISKYPTHGSDQYNYDCP